MHRVIVCLTVDSFLATKGGSLQGPLSTWVEMQCCHELLQHLLLGFELDCYLPCEFCMLYW